MSQPDPYQIVAHSPTEPHGNAWHALDDHLDAVAELARWFGILLEWDEQASRSTELR